MSKIKTLQRRLNGLASGSVMTVYSFPKQTASVPLAGYAAFIHYIQHVLTHVVDMPITFG